MLKKQRRKFAKNYDSKNQLLIHVRKKSEFDAEHVLGVINIPLDEINKHIAEFPKDKPFVLNCAADYHSMIASSMLKF